MIALYVFVMVGVPMLLVSSRFVLMLSYTTQSNTRTFFKSRPPIVRNAFFPYLPNFVSDKDIWNIALVHGGCQISHCILKDLPSSDGIDHRELNYGNCGE